MVLWIKTLDKVSVKFEEVEKLHFFKKMTRDQFNQLRGKVDTAVPIITLNLANSPPQSFDINDESDGGIFDDQVAKNPSPQDLRLPNTSTDCKMLHDICEAKDKNLCSELI
jgi:hypothetical protein